MKEGFYKNFLLVITSNVVSIIVSLLVVMIVPKFVGVEEYGYFQLYLFYSTYVGFLHLGWNDGLYLKLGGTYYTNLNKSLLNSQFVLYVLVQTIVAIIIILISLNITDTNLSVVLLSLAPCIVLTNTKFLLLSILQTTNRIKESSYINLLDRIFYLIMISFFLLISVNLFEYFIIADLIGKFFSLLIAIYYCREFIIQRVVINKNSILEVFDNIKIGMNLMFANISNMLIIGIVRFGIERTWGISIFSKISLTLNLANFILVFINSIGIIMFPLIKRCSRNNYFILYKQINNILVPILLACILLYYPVFYIFSSWLPEYQDGLKYLFLLFPLIVFEGKMGLLIITFYKALRKEKDLFKINLIMLSISLVLTCIFTLLIKNIDYTVATILLVLCCRTIIMEYFLFDTKRKSSVPVEIFLIIIFLVSCIIFSILISFMIYLVSYCIYFYLVREKFIYSLKEFYRLTKDKNLTVN